MHVHVDRSSRTAPRTDGPRRPPPQSARYEAEGFRLARTIERGKDLAVVKAATDIALENKHKLPVNARTEICRAARVVIRRYRRLAAAQDNEQLRQRAQAIVEGLEAITTGIPFNRPANKANAKPVRLERNPLF